MSIHLPSWTEITDDFDVELPAAPEIEEELNACLEWGKKNLSPTRYAAYTAHMRKVAYEIKWSASLINSLNLDADEAVFAIQECRNRLHDAAEKFTGMSIPYAGNKEQVVAARSAVDAEIRQMAALDSDKTFQFPSADKIATCLQKHPLTSNVYRYLNTQGVIGKLALALADQEISSADMRLEVMDAVDELKLGNAGSKTTDISLMTALPDCASKDHVEEEKAKPEQKISILDLYAAAENFY